MLRRVFGATFCSCRSLAVIPLSLHPAPCPGPNAMYKLHTVYVYTVYYILPTILLYAIYDDMISL